MVTCSSFPSLRITLRAAAIALLLLAPLQAAAQLVISEFRVRGPNGANDEYIVLTNNAGSPHTVAAASGTGYGVAASDGVTRCTIPNGTVIPARGHFLCTNSVAYSLGGYATGDATYTTDIPDNAGIALFNNNVPANFILANRLDAVGSTSEANTLYKEGTGYPALTPFSIDYAFVRDNCGQQGSITNLTACPFGGVPGDTNNNAVDFYFVDTNGTSAGAGQRLGAPGPQNLASPINRGTGLTTAVLDSCAAATAPPNLVRDLTSVPAQNSTFGTVDLRYTFTNTSGANLTALRFRVVAQTTFPAPSGFADLRSRTSSTIPVTVDRPPCGSTSSINVEGRTLEQPPSSPNGSAFNGSLSVPTITPGTPLANGASIDLRFLFGVQQTGAYRIGLVPEGLPEIGTAGGVIEFVCSTEVSGCAPPTVVSIARADPDPTNAAVVNYTVTFDKSVTGADASDFALTTAGLAGSSVGTVSGSGATRNVAVNTGTGTGTLRLDLVDNDSIVDSTFSKPLGGAGAGNGNFNGEVYSIDKTGPSVTINQAGAQADPTALSPINFTVTFSEAVSGFTAADVTLGGTAGATTALVSGSGAVYNVAVSGMTANGTVTATVNAGAVTDALGNPSLASTSTDNTVTFTVTSFTGTTGTGTGSATASFTGGGAGCAFSGPQFIAAPPGAPPVPPVAPPNVTFPQGLFTFSTTGCTVGSTLSFTIVFPQPLSPGTQYWKYGPTAATPGAHWYVLPATIVGNTVTFTITDGGLGDDDLTANGTIVDQGGPGVTVATIPTLSEWAMLLLALLLLTVGLAYLRRR